MKQAGLLALTISLIILCGCSDSAKYEDMYKGWRSNCLSLAEHETQAELSASDDEKVCSYTLLYKLDAESETVEVLAPAMIANITAHIENDGTQLSFDGAILETGSALTNKLSPLMALPTFMDIIREGHIENSWRETRDGAELIVTELETPDGTIMTLWQNCEDMSPVYADMRSGERVQIKIKFIKFI